MKNFQKGGPKFGGKKFGGSSGFDRGGFKPRFDARGSDRPIQLHQATCAECQKMCEVPFRPNGEKPVYCRDCFASKGGPAAGRDFSPRPARPSFGDRKSFGPRQDFRPRQDFAPRGGDNGDLKAELSAISAKLDRLIEVMSPKPIKAASERAEAPVAKKAAKKKASAKKK